MIFDVDFKPHQKATTLNARLLPCHEDLPTITQMQRPCAESSSFLTSGPCVGLPPSSVLRIAPSI